MPSSSEQSSEIELLINQVKTLMIKIYKQTFEAEYSSLYSIAFEAVNDEEAAKNILDDSLNETVVAILESGFEQFEKDMILNKFKHRINETCEKYIEENDAEQKFQMIHGHSVPFDSTVDEDIMKVVFKALDKLPPATKKILIETLATGSTPRKVAENNNLETGTVLKMKWKAIKQMKEFIFNK